MPKLRFEMDDLTIEAEGGQGDEWSMTLTDTSDEGPQAIATVQREAGWVKTRTVEVSTTELSAILALAIGLGEVAVVEGDNLNAPTVDAFYIEAEDVLKRHDIPVNLRPMP